MTDTKAPAEWKNYDDFASGIATNRLPITDALVAKKFAITFEDGRKLNLHFSAANTLAWKETAKNGEGKCEVINVAPDTYFIDITFSNLPTEAETVVLNKKTGRVLSIRSIVREAGAHPGEPRVAQIFRA